MKKTGAILAAVSLALALGTAGMTSGAEDMTKNPYAGKQNIVKEGKKVYDDTCKACHGEGGKGDICPDLQTKKKKFGNSDADLFATISKGRPGGMPNWDNALGPDRIWKVITYLRSIEK